MDVAALLSGYGLRLWLASYSLPPFLRGVVAPRPAIPLGHPLSNPRVPHAFIV